MCSKRRAAWRCGSRRDSIAHSLGLRQPRSIQSELHGVEGARSFCVVLGFFGVSAKPCSRCAGNVPDPDCIWGHSEVQVRVFLGQDFERFEAWMLMKAAPVCAGMPPCLRVHGRCFYDVDLRQFVARRS